MARLLSRHSTKRKHRAKTPPAHWLHFVKRASFPSVRNPYRAKASARARSRVRGMSFFSPGTSLDRGGRVKKQHQSPQGSRIPGKIPEADGRQQQKDSQGQPGIQSTPFPALFHHGILPPSLYFRKLYHTLPTPSRQLCYAAPKTFFAQLLRTSPGSVAQRGSAV